MSYSDGKNETPSQAETQPQPKSLIASNGELDTQSSAEDNYALATSLLPGGGPVSDEDYQSALRLERSEHGDEALSLYVHLPFCPSRCLTCNHQTTVTHDARDIDRYIDTLEREMALMADQLGTRRSLQQLHLGGGTPNYLSEIQIVRLMGIVERHFALTSETEASLDANAHRASHAQLSLLHGLGFRAINLEVRDLNPEVLSAVGRSQSLAVIRDVVDSAREIGFNRVSTDLVYGLPMQTPTSIGETLQQLLTLNPDRIHCFAYSRRQDTFEHQRAVDVSMLPSLGDKLASFSRIVDTLCSASYQWIGLDCFALERDPIAAAQKEGTLHRNWIGYTPQHGRRVIGVGSSSVTDLSAISVRNHNSIEHWRQAVEAGRLPAREGELLSREQREQRYALSDLMCNLESSSIEPLFGVEDDDCTQTLRTLVDKGLLELDGSHVSVTEEGRFTLHRIWGDAAAGHRRDFLV